VDSSLDATLVVFVKIVLGSARERESPMTGALLERRSRGGGGRVRCSDSRVRSTIRSSAPHMVGPRRRHRDTRST